MNAKKIDGISLLEQKNWVKTAESKELRNLFLGIESAEAF